MSRVEPAESFGKQQPTVLGEMREQLLANWDNPHLAEVRHEVVDQRRSVGRMAYRRRHD